jgi:hypothetical protein
MKNLSLKVEKDGLRLSPTDAEKSPAELAAETVKSVMLVSGQAKRGFSETDRRSFYKVCDALDAAVRAGAESVQLEDSWAAFVVESFKTNLMPNVLLRQVEENVEGMK